MYSTNIKCSSSHKRRNVTKRSKQNIVKKTRIHIHTFILNIYIGGLVFRNTMDECIDGSIDRSFVIENDLYETRLNGYNEPNNSRETKNELNEEKTCSC